MGHCSPPLPIGLAPNPSLFDRLLVRIKINRENTRTTKAAFPYRLIYRIDRVILIFTSGFRLVTTQNVVLCPFLPILSLLVLQAELFL
jgi:hypothetical protein